jgi:hypothetical protein
VELIVRCCPSGDRSVSRDRRPGEPAGVTQQVDAQQGARPLGSVADRIGRRGALTVTILRLPETAHRPLP